MNLPWMAQDWEDQNLIYNWGTVNLLAHFCFAVGRAIAAALYAWVGFWCLALPAAVGAASKSNAAQTLLRNKSQKPLPVACGRL